MARPVLSVSELNRAARSALEHELADVWVEGLTDRDGDARLITAQVVTDLGFGGGPLAEPVPYDLRFVERSGNNYRYEWYLSEHVGRSEVGDYRYWFRFSVDGGETFYRIGAGEGPEGGEARRLHVRP